MNNKETRVQDWREDAKGRTLKKRGTFLTCVGSVGRDDERTTTGEK